MHQTAKPLSESNHPQTLRVLMIEDSEDDALLIIRALKKGGYDPVYQREETAAGMAKALQEKEWDIVLCDYKMPRFSAPAAIRLLQETRLDLPIIIISGTMGEDAAIECMRLGAQDYIMKTNLSRLGPAIARELEEVKLRKKQKQAEVERLAALELLIQSEEKYRNILESIQESYFEVDLAGNFTFVNDNVCQSLGYPREEILGVNYRRYTVPEDAQKVYQAFHEVFKTGKPNNGFSWRIVAKNGAMRYIEGSISLIKDSFEKPVGFRGIARDITEQKEMEEKLREEEQKIRALTEQSSDIILLIDKKGEIIYENKAVAKLLGYSPKERIGARLLENIHPDDLEKNVATVRKLFDSPGQPPVRAELRIRDKNGRWRVFEEVASGLTKGNVVEALIINLRDITERKRAEEALVKSEERYRNLVENANIGIYEINYDTGHLTNVNDRVCKYTGYSREEILSMPFLELFTPESRMALMGRFAKLQAGEKLPPTAEYCVKTKSGQIIWISIHADYIYENGRLKRSRGILQNITERKLAEEAMRASEKKYRDIFENAIEGIYQVTPEGKFITANAAFARMAGYDSPEELIDHIQNIQTQLYVHPEDRIRFLDQIREKGLVNNFETEFKRKDGSAFWVSINARAVKDERGNITYHEGFIEDITARKKAEEGLNKILDNLRKAIGTTIHVLVSVLESRDPYTAGHQSRSADLACAIAREIGLPEDRIEGIRMASVIHDIGKLSIPAEILTKPAKLTDLEYALIKEHARSGYDMLKDVESPWPLAEIVYQHHERFDGSGYPRHLQGDEILLEARILGVADVVEAMASHRPYRPSLGVEAALEEIEKNRGILYDPKVADACLRLFREKNYKFEQQKVSP